MTPFIRIEYVHEDGASTSETKTDVGPFPLLMSSALSTVVPPGTMTDVDERILMLASYNVSMMMLL